MFCMPNRKQKQIPKSHEIRYQWLLSQGIEISRTPPSCPRALVAESHVQASKQELIHLIKQKAIQVVKIEKKKKEDAVSNGEGSASQ